ncbi:MAG: copper transporter, partial [Nocardioidaceae bacterium]
GQVFTAAFSSAAAPALLDKGLEGTSVTLFALPGIGHDTVVGLKSAIKAAGGTPVATIDIHSDYINPAKKTYVDSVATNSSKGVKDIEGLKKASTYQVSGALIARAYTGKGDVLSVDDEATKIDGRLQGAKLLDLDGDLKRRGSLAVVLAPGTHGRDEVTTAQHEIASDLVTALANGSAGVLVTAPATTSMKGGLVAGLTAAKDAPSNLATLNVAGTPGSPVAAVYALVALAHDSAGDYGVVDGKAVLPPGLN